MELTEVAWYMYPVILLAGLASGFINTLAGNGSAIVLPLLVTLGLPPTMANGTNRVGVIVQSLVGFLSFKKAGLVQMQGIWWLVSPAIVGAMIGAQIAVELNERSMNLSLGLLMIFLLVLVLIKPKQWLKDTSSFDIQRVKSPSTLVSMFLIGLHGGFLQAGVGVMLLAAMVLSAGFTVKRANGIKLLIVVGFTVPALLTFLYNGQIYWPFAILLTISQSLGALLAARFAIDSPKINIWVRRLLIVVILLGMMRFFSAFFYVG